jgi:hypothetical protein
MELPKALSCYFILPRIKLRKFPHYLLVEM